MDTPNSKSISTSNSTNNKLINPPSSDSHVFLESPVFSYISNLSPIQPVKTAHVAQGFPGLASPPLVFTSPRTNSRLSIFNRQLRSSVSISELSQDHDKCLKIDEDSGEFANLDLGLQSPVSSNPKICYVKKFKQVAQGSTSGCFVDFLADPMGCMDSSCKIQPDVADHSSEICCSEKKDNSIDEVTVPDGSTCLKVLKSVQETSKISVKVVKNEPQDLISAPSECSDIFTRLPKAPTSELCQIEDSYSEVSHLDRGSLRRCLFDENQRKYSGDASEVWNPNENLTSIQEVANLPPSGTLSSCQMINLPKPVTGMNVFPSTGNHSVSISKPLGTGLHLNSVVYPRATEGTNRGQQSSEKVVRVKGNNLVVVMSNQPAGKVNASSNQVDEDPASSEGMYQKKPSSIATSNKPLASDAVEQLNSSIALKPDDPSASACVKRKFNSVLAKSNEEFKPVSPVKKRKKLSSAEDDTSKRCNCKKSKCLKLYCDCFAAGFYCGDSCACQGCCNRHEYEDTVLETRQQIESRNPLAFAPKVVQPVIDSPAISKEIADLSTPSSAKHKRGCNCKKSMCLKKYCECYQFNVGCSDNCRCEGCKNVHGKREDLSIPREFMIKISETQSEGIFYGKQDMQTISSNIENCRAHKSPKMTPDTPALQCSDLRKNAIKSQLPFRMVLQSPDSNDMLISVENFTSRSSPNHSLLLEGRKSPSVGLPDPDESCDNLERLPSCERPANTTHPVLSDTSPLSKTSNLIHVSQSDSFAGSGLPPPSSHLRWRSSPMTPITQSARSEFLQNFDSFCENSDTLGDDTPEILKDSATPIESVKVRSPNKKRISPPHNSVSSPESLRSSRKFVLKAVCGALDDHPLAKFPPLTPNSRSSGIGRRSESSGP